MMSPPVWGEYLTQLGAGALSILLSLTLALAAAITSAAACGGSWIETSGLFDPMTWLGSWMSTRPAAPLPVATQRAAITGRALAADAVRVALASEEEALDDDLGCSLLVLAGLAGLVVSV